MDRYVLGLNVGNHDSAAALIKNGELAVFIEQERISRNKMAIGEPPIEAVLACLKHESITLQEVSAISVGMDWRYRNEKYEMSDLERSKYASFEDPDWFLPSRIFGDRLPPIYSIRHHLSHASSAYRTSGFSRCAVMVVDNRGEDASTSLGFANDGKIEFFKQINIHNSLGVFYNRAASFAGLYGKYREVGKFMGLGSYGKPTMRMPLSPSRDNRLFKVLPDIERAGIFEALGKRTSQLMSFFEENCFPYEIGNYEEIMSYADFAASAQHALEDVLLDFAKELKEVTQEERLVIAGGVALNCSANGKIEQSGLFHEIFVPPFASDSGTAVGSALEVYHQLFGGSASNHPLRNAGLGIAYSNSDVEDSLQKYKNQIRHSHYKDTDLCRFISHELSTGKIVGWMQDGFEAGPRALGFRSILADPRTRRSLIKLNQIKEREMWRPIAPSVLVDYFSDYFEGNPDSKYFMNVATIVKENKRKEIVAVVHVDNTARPQVVTPTNGRFYELLQSFYKETGVPVLCNTSFNSRGVPLVNTPENAIDCFLQRPIDILVIGNLVIEKI